MWHYPLPVQYSLQNTRPRSNLFLRHHRQSYFVLFSYFSSYFSTFPPTSTTPTTATTLYSTPEYTLSTHIRTSTNLHNILRRSLSPGTSVAVISTTWFARAFSFSLGWCFFGLLVFFLFRFSSSSSSLSLLLFVFSLIYNPSFHGLRRGCPPSPLPLVAKRPCIPFPPRRLLLCPLEFFPLNSQLSVSILRYLSLFRPSLPPRNAYMIV